jgi:hypothetical protein
MKETLKILYLIDHLESNYPRDQNYINKFMIEQGHEVEVIIKAKEGVYSVLVHIYNHI